MAIKVIQGLVGRTPPDNVQNKVGTGSSVQEQRQLAQKAATSPAAQTNAAQVARNSEAAITNFRLAGNSSTQEKIRDPEEASDLARDLADRIKNDDEEVNDAHGNLSSTSAREHIIN